MLTWNEAVTHYKRVTDKLGKKIDKGIFDTVVVLNMLEVTTVASCEGHIGWGCPYPWIHTEANLETKFRLHQYLTRFYQDRSTDFDCELAFHGYRLHSRGGAFYELFSEEEQAQKLIAYQTEMQCFTVFLKSLLDQ